MTRQSDEDDAAKASLRSSDAVRTWLDSLLQFSDKIPPLQKPLLVNGFTIVTT